MKKLTPLKIVALYISAYIIWIVGTDMLVTYIPMSDTARFKVSVAKGVFSVFVSAFFLYWIIFKYSQQIKQVEKSLNEAKTELERSNKELELFGSSISHDLRAPLRHIESFIRILAEDYSEKLDEQGRDYIRRVQVASARMQELTSALLNMARIAGGELNRSKVYLTSFVKTTAAELVKSHPDRRVEFIIADDVTAEGDPVLLRIVIQNLMDNAFKFTGKRESARIEFGVKHLSGKQVYFVKDDGVGFSMENANRLFTPFQRFHTTTEFPGLGIGLATAQRIIHHHGGSMCAESTVNKGATFYFTLQ